MIIDSHVHIYSSQFDEDRSEVIANAQAVGVTQMFLPAIDSHYAEKMFEMEAQYPTLMSLMMGLHPVYVKPETYEYELEKVYNWLIERPFAAVGEIGIDLHWDQSTLAIQKEAFRRQISWAREFDLPIVIHSRESFDEVFEILEENKDLHAVKGIFHCFTGDEVQAKRAIDLGFKLGIGGVVTYKNSNLDEVLQSVTIQDVVVETDAPYLAPTPYRGKRNEPKYLVEITEKLATIYQMPLHEIQNITAENALSIFKNY